MIIEAKYGALCAFPWKASEEDPSQIEGRWAEDDSPYVVTCPAQLRDQLVDLQGRLYDELASLKDLQKEVNEQRRRLDVFLGGSYNA